MRERTRGWELLNGRKERLTVRKNERKKRMQRNLERNSGEAVREKQKRGEVRIPERECSIKRKREREGEKNFRMDGREGR